MMVEYLTLGALVLMALVFGEVASQLKSICDQIRRIAFWSEDYFEDKKMIDEWIKASKERRDEDAAD